MGFLRKNMNKLRNQFIYQIFVRNYSNEGTLNKVTEDLDRLVDLGVDVVYFMPLQPIGDLGRKGKYGSPYAIKDYKAISPDLGTLEDFKNLIKVAHSKGLKVILDIVFHHSAPDHHWTKEHPEFYVWKNGKLSNKVGDWSDIADFEYDNNPKLIEALHDVLDYWVEMGLDGFRFDVASLIPAEFYEYSFPRLRAKNPDLIMLAESVHFSFLNYIRFHKHVGLSDAELYQYFDVLYDYDAHEAFMGYLREGKSLDQWVNMMKMQETIYPQNYVKARNVENHDNPRIQYYTQSYEKTLQWLGYVFFAKGIAFINNGFETGTDNLNLLFEKDPIDFSKIKPDWVDLIKKLAKMKKEPIFAQDHGYKIVSHSKDVIHLEYHTEDEIRVGIFNVGANRGILTVDLPEGKYINQLTGKEFMLRFGSVELMDYPLVFSIDLKNKQEANH